MAMENKLENIGQNNFMDNFVKTEDILKKIYMWNYWVLFNLHKSLMKLDKGYAFVARQQHIHRD